MKKILLAMAALLLISSVGFSQVQVTRKKKQEVAEQTAPSKPRQLTAKEMYEKGEKEYNRKNYDEAINWWRKSAEKGYVKAQYDLGLTYQHGYAGQTINFAEAMKWYKLAAEQGDVSAQHNLGYMYDWGQGVAENKAEAFKWYLKAAEQGDDNSQYAVGTMYEYGYGVAPNKKEAVKWYIKAAEQNHGTAKDALRRLGIN